MSPKNVLAVMFLAVLVPGASTAQSLWSLVPPERPRLPRTADTSWPKNAIDSFVLARLEGEGLVPSVEARRERLLRRLTLDLTGLPPAIPDIDVFLADDSPDAFERVVDRLLASPRHGERMAMEWLDLARYADTDGYQDDEPRVMWRWRDWVIDALNSGMSFDRFTIEQLAGDMLPGASPEQKLATGFNRNNRTNGEGGSIAAEFRIEYIVDRVETMSSVWIGLTIGCARCHDHKHDPITQRDFYRLFAFFNNIPEKGTYRGNSDPVVRVPTRLVSDRLEEIERRLSTKIGPAEQQALQEQKAALLESVPTTMVLQEGTPRDTFILVRGQYDRPGEGVTAGVPESLPALPDGVAANRLELARWIVADSNPLTARVVVNRIWRLCFGSGLVKTVADFGTRGDPPSHPRLLDWLATEFVRRRWDVRALQRAILSSSTYRQSSKVTPALLDRDPENRLVARGPRVRLDAEMIRDQALHASGLLVTTIGGPSVKPYQPPGLWQEIAGGSSGAYAGGYRRDEGAKLYRRSMYTFWRRTIPPPSMTAFDAPSREICAADRARTNTPLQALALMNEVTYVEAARALAERMMLAGGTTPAERIVYAFRCVLTRRPLEVESSLLADAFVRYLGHYRANREAAQALVTVGESLRDPDLDFCQLAAYTAVAHVILNLDEAVMKE